MQPTIRYVNGSAALTSNSLVVQVGVDALADAARDAKTVVLAKGEGAQDQQVERALQQAVAGGGHSQLL